MGVISNRSIIHEFSKCHHCDCMSLLCSSFISGIKSPCVPVWRFESYNISAQSMEEQEKGHGNWASLASDDRRSSFFHSTMPFNLDSNATAQLPPPCLCTFRYSDWMQMLHQMSAMKMQITMETKSAIRSGPGTTSIRRKSPKTLVPEMADSNQQLADSQNWLKLLYHLQHARC